MLNFNPLYFYDIIIYVLKFTQLKKNAFAFDTLSRTYGTGSLLMAFLCLCFSVLYPPENSDLHNKGNMQNWWVFLFLSFRERGQFPCWKDTDSMKLLIHHNYKPQPPSFWLNVSHLYFTMWILPCIWLLTHIHSTQ